MAAAYITTADIFTAIPSARLTQLFVDDDVSNTIRARTIGIASGIVKAAAYKAGYTSLGDTTTNEQVIAATLGQFIVLAYNRAGISLPPEFFEIVQLATEIREGRVPLEGMTPVLRDAVGGASFSETSTSISGARYQVLSRTALEGY